MLFKIRFFADINKMIFFWELIIVELHEQINMSWKFKNDPRSDRDPSTVTLSMVLFAKRNQQLFLTCSVVGIDLLNYIPNLVVEVIGPLLR